MSHIKLGKSGALKVASVKAARAALAQDAKAGRREVPDVGKSCVRVNVSAPGVAAFLKSRKRSPMAA